MDININNTFKIVKLVHIAEELRNSGIAINDDYFNTLNIAQGKIMNDQEYDNIDLSPIWYYLHNSDRYQETMDILIDGNFFGYNEKVQLEDTFDYEKFYMMRYGNDKFCVFKLNNNHEIIAIDVEWYEHMNNHEDDNNIINNDDNNIIDNVNNNNVNNNIINNGNMMDIDDIININDNIDYANNNNQVNNVIYHSNY